jgi:formylglycine-generating enzyme
MKSLFLFLSLLLSGFLCAQDRYALVVGNANYQVQSLSNQPITDANTVATALRNCGFDVTVKSNLTGEEFERTVSQFGAKLQSKPGALRVFYYAGHGVEMDGANYLLPTDNQTIADDAALRRRAVPMSYVRQHIEATGSHSIFFLDACRDNPLPKAFSKSRTSGYRGLVAEETSQGSVLIFAAAPGKTAADNGVFASELATHLITPGLDIYDIYQKTSKGVRERSGGTQRPNYLTEVEDKIVLVPAKKQDVVPAPTSRGIDSDNDGITDTHDECPHQYGTFARNGCPEPVKPKPTALVTDDPMVLIRGGSFQRGSEENDNEKPIKQITVSDFYLSKYEVTLADFRAFVEATNHQTDAENAGYSFKFTTVWVKGEGVNWRHDANGQLQTNERHPVIHVSWNDAQAYCQWLSKKTGKTYRLPTEAEWEYAAGNGSRHTRYSWGNGNPSGQNGGNVTDESKSPINGASWSTKFDGYNDGYWFTAPVGSYNANDFGLYDMTGNVWEWCSDWYRKDYYQNSLNTNPTGPGSGSSRVFRGGSWGSFPQNCRVAFRNDYSPGYSYYVLGFRLARTN